ncbi:site-specific integrase [Phenylobacterium sp.]|jgi:integrase|uniref:tyrosine-type recombinase/integrase n=1 Tax=Phenylobacterium sp. TaxID=1871053 RepID=UPI002E364830|nr:site-specific integrase [Phenylobacterium sp.]HEX3365376.1 site-specific integrase [Phenylobacterium sp.]
MAFVTDKEVLKPGLIIFRRADVDHRNWYCRVKLPKADRYKTVSLKTSDINAARELAFDQDSDVRFRLKHDVPVFNHPFRTVAQEYLATQEARAKRGEISKERPKKLKAVIEGALEDYVGSTQVHLIGDELWIGYPAWRRENGAGRNKRNGVREISAEKAAELDARDAAGRARAMEARGFRQFRPPAAAAPTESRAVAFISDATIRFEMSIFGAVMNYAIKKRYVAASQRFDDRPKLKTMRRDEFTLEEYRHLHTVGRSWVKAAPRPSSTWYRTVAYNFILIMCNTGMRPSEAKNLRWRDITSAADREGQELVVMFVQGKGKSRKLVAPKSVGDYFERIREATRKYRRDAAKAKKAKDDEGAKAPDVVFRPEDRVFTTVTGQPAKSLYQALIEDLLIKAKLREGASGVPRSTYCFRHTYATFRLAEGVDVYFLAEQMGTSVKMIEEHYGHVNTVKHADLVLQGMHSWEPDAAVGEVAAEDTKAERTPRAKARTAQPGGKLRRRNG